MIIRIPKVFIFKLDRIIKVSIIIPKEIKIKMILKAHLINILTLIIENNLI